MNWYLKVLRNYTDFKGRARRKEYWFFMMFNMVFLIVAIIIDNVLGTLPDEFPFGLFYLLYVLAIFIPGLAVTVRRLHDIGKSGWYYFVILIPFIGGIWLLVLLLTDSIPGENQYGLNSKESHFVNSINHDSTLSSTENERSIADTLILIAVIWMIFSRLLWFVLAKFVVNLYSTEWFKIVNGINWMIWGFIPIILATAVKNKSKRMALFILGGIYLYFSIYEIVIQFI
jgi:uncharacterized membrane protein YhaH (DUF805 family)